MKTKIALLSVVLLVFCVSGCSNSDSSAVSQSETTTSEITTTTAPAKTTAPCVTEPVKKSEERKNITAEVKAFKDNYLTFEYEGKEHTLYFDRGDFKDNTAGLYPNESERIINNKLGETVYGKLSLNKDMTKLYACDIINTNGIIYQGMEQVDDDRQPIVENLYKFVRKDDTLCEISNSTECFELDLNDLAAISKIDYPQEAYPVLFDAYKFKDGKMMLLELSVNISADETGVHTDFNKFTELYSSKLNNVFFGTVQSISEDRKKISVLLNDKKTLCIVPTYFNDGGQITEGMDIMINLKSDTSLFGSGGTHEFDYAVISTDEKYYNQTGLNIYVNNSNWIRDRIEFKDLAYASHWYDNGISQGGSLVNFFYTTVAQAEEKKNEKSE